MIAALLDHLWQSTLFAGLAGVLTLMLRHNGARLRFWLWFAASAKFLVPFSVLVMMGEGLSRLFATALPATPALLAMRPAAQPFSVPALAAPVTESLSLLPWLLGIWALGLLLLLGVRLLRWRQLRALVASATVLDWPAPVPVKSTASLLEPGLVGIIRPVILLPRGMLDVLTADEQSAILAHELSHLRRRDNLLAAIHMLAETVFWFFPPVWLIGARLIAERERACDEAVVAQGHDGEVYATSILKVCKFYLQSPLACAAGATGANLSSRVQWIMEDRAAAQLDTMRRAVLLVTGALMLALPLAVGFLAFPLGARIHQTVAAVQSQLVVNQVAAQALVSDMAQAIIHSAKPVARPVRRTPRDVTPLVAGPVTVERIVAPAPAAPVIVRPQDALAGAAVPETLRAPLVALTPTGAGDPEAITCRAPQRLSASRLSGPQVCKANRIWARLRATGLDISPDGTQIIATAARARVNGPCLVSMHFSGVSTTAICL